MRACLSSFFLLVLLSSGLFATPVEKPDASQETMFFLENKGQITDQFGQYREDIDFKIVSRDVNVFIGSGRVHYQWVRFTETGSSVLPVGSNGDIQSYRLDVELQGSNANAQLQREGKQPYFETFYFPELGNAGARAKSYQKITYKDIYPNIDWVLYISDGGLKYDFIVHPGGKIKDIKMKYKGATSLQIGHDGRLTAKTPFGDLYETAPFSYQDDGKVINSLFILNDEVLSYEVGSFDGKLIIDPALVWSSYYGGNGMFDGFESSTVDRYGNLFLAGGATSTNNIATTGSHQVTLGGGQDAMLVKFASTGELAWGTYLGAQGSDLASSVACDSNGNVYLAGVTTSTTAIATSASYQDAFSGGSVLGDAFIVKFDSSGSRYWGTYFGGAGDENIPQIAIHGNNLYMAGGTESSSDIATSGSFQEFKQGSSDGYLAKFSLDGALIWSTYWGGESTDYLFSVDIDPGGNVFVSGITESNSNIASPGSYQSTRGGLADAFVGKFSSDGNKIWSTYFGGPNAESVMGRENIACDNAGSVYLVGATESSTGIATPGMLQEVYQGQADGFLVKFDSTGLREWGTYIGGSELDFVTSVKCNKNLNSVYLTGNTNSAVSNIPTPDAYQSNFGGVGAFSTGDAYLLKIDGHGNLDYGTYYGAAGDDYGLTVAVNEEGDVYISGITNSSGMATTGSHQTVYPGAMLFSPFIAKFCFALLPPHMDVIGADTVCNSGSYVYSIDPDEGAEGYIWTLPAGWMGSSDSNSIEVLPNGVGGQISVQVVKCDDTSNRIVKNISLFPSNPATIRIDGYVLRTQQPYARYQWCLNGLPISGAINSTYTVLENGDYSVITETEMGCVDTSDMYTVTNAPNAIDESRSISDTYVYPNPASDKLHVNCPVDFEAVLLNVEGKVLYNIINSNLMDIKSLAPGVYFLNIRDRERRPIKTEKIIKR